MTLYCDTLDSPLGELHLVVDDLGQLLRIDLPGSRAPARDEVTSPAKCRHVARQLCEYFAGERQKFELDLAAEGTEFQCRAWRSLMRIPFGRTQSYRQQAERLGNANAVRAVGQANGRNPIPIVVPCHRVIGKDGSLTGFGGGLHQKQWLLQHEAAVLARSKGRKGTGGASS
jgi:methylated-DNA-[protein]-cysteine S-methyltransferase